MSNDLKKPITTLAVIALLSIFLTITIKLPTMINSMFIGYLSSKIPQSTIFGGLTGVASFLIQNLSFGFATPMAEALKQASFFSWLAFGAANIEIRLQSLFGFIMFMITIPSTCVLLIMYHLKNDHKYVLIAKKVMVISLAFFLIIPISVIFSMFIDLIFNIGFANNPNLITRTLAASIFTVITSIVIPIFILFLFKAQIQKIFHKNIKLPFEDKIMAKLKISNHESKQ